MPMLKADPEAEERIREERRALGLDAHDEVWNGVYFMPPLANNEHQIICGRLTIILGILVELPGLGRVLPGANVTDRTDDWTQNYRVPDVLIFLNGTSARDCNTHWLGGPDLAVEIMSTGDKSRDKLPFYANVNTRELILIDRDPWSVELYRFENRKMRLVGVSTLASPAQLSSQIVPLHFKLAPAAVRPVIEVVHQDGLQRWIV